LLSVFYMCLKLGFKIKGRTLQGLFENACLRKIFGPTRPEEMHDSYAPYYSGDLINEGETGGHVVGIGEK
jgi:hypothetical protein